MNRIRIHNTACSSVTHLSALVAVSCFFLYMPLRVAGQERFTDYLTRKNDGQGKVTVQQDPDIERLVNGTPPSRGSQTAPHVTRNGENIAASDSVMGARDSSQFDSRLLARRARMNGFRIQVYAGGNNRKSKTEAFHAAGLVRSYFEDVPVYTHFLSPRWICRVGDFRTIEEAREMLGRMRESGQFPEATIVKTKIIVYL